MSRVTDQNRFDRDPSLTRAIVLQASVGRLLKAFLLATEYGRVSFEQGMANPIQAKDFKAALDKTFVDLESLAESFSVSSTSATIAAIQKYRKRSSLSDEPGPDASQSLKTWAEEQGHALFGSPSMEVLLMDLSSEASELLEAVSNPESLRSDVVLELGDCFFLAFRAEAAMQE